MSVELTAREKRLYAKARQEFWAHHPRVRRLRKPVPCEGVKWSQVAFKHLYAHGPGQAVPAEGIPDRAKCKRMAKWHFAPLRKSRARKGNYCWTHLVHAGLWADMDEEAATKRWGRRHHSLWVEICERLGIAPGSDAEEAE